MSWKFVFNTNLAPDKFWGNSLDTAITFIEPTGYRFFVWNGMVYDITGKDTGIKVEDLQ